MPTQAGLRVLVVGAIHGDELSSAAVALALECVREGRRRKLALSLENLPDSMRNLAQLYAVSDLLQADPV